MKRVAVFSVPRSGSSWLGQLINSSENVAYSFQPLFSYKFKDALNDSSDKSEVVRFFNDICKTDDVFVRGGMGGGVSFEKKEITHSVFKEVRYLNLIEHLHRTDDELQFVFLVRNPIDVISSWVNAPKEFDTSWDINEELVEAANKNQGKPEEYYGLGKWVEACNIFSSIEDRSFIIRYEDLVKDTAQEVSNLFGFLGLEFGEQTKNFIEDSTTKHSEDPYSVFKGKRSKNTLPSSIITRIESTVSGLSDFQ
jgi:hypothetical protein